MRGWLVAVVLAGCGSPDGHHALLPYAIDASAKAHQPLVVEFNAVWCKPCELFAKTVLTDPRVVAALADVYFVQYDIDTNAGRDAQRRCHVDRVPTVVGIDAQGYVQLKKTGTEPTADQFLEFLREAHARLGAQPK
jgi:thiol:disulfide interchange protein